ncbi:RraA family protein [Planctomycetota bacterium]
MNIKSPALRLALVTIILLSLPAEHLLAQALRFTKEDLIKFTPEWKGERFPDGRPKVPDSILKRMEKVAIEEAWSVLRSAKYDYQFERGWKHVHPGGVLVGRALTVMYMPKRTVVNNVINEEGKKDGRIGNQVSWPIDMLVKGDVYVADVYGREIGGPIIGSNLGTSIFAKSGNGVVFDGEIRDLEGLETIEGFNAFVRDWNPSSYWASMIMGINTPIRIGRATVMPGDVVLGKREGVIFIPAHLAEKVVKTSEIVRLRDAFGFQRLREGKYTPGQIDGRWPDEIEKDFSQWLKDHIDELPVPKEQIQELLKERTW